MGCSEGKRSFPGRRRLCAVCHIEFFGPELSEMIWCATDRFYVCGRCFDIRCKGHDQRGSVWWGLFLLVLPWTVATPVGLFGLGEIIRGLIGQNPDGKDIAAFAAAAVMAGVYLVPLSSIRYYARHRERLHAGQIAGALPVEAPGGLATRPPGVEWMDNDAGSERRSLATGWLVGFIMMAGIFTAFFLTGARDYFDCYIFGAILAFPAGVTAIFLERRMCPDEIGVDGNGIHFWYRIPRRRLLLGPFIPWAAVEDLRNESGKYGTRIFKLRTGRYLPLDIFRSGNEGILPMLWTRWKQTGTIRNASLNR